MAGFVRVFLKSVRLPWLKKEKTEEDGPKGWIVGAGDGKIVVKVTGETKEEVKGLVDELYRKANTRLTWKGKEFYLHAGNGYGLILKHGDGFETTIKLTYKEV